MTTNWRNHAACYGEDPELWFPLGTDGRWTTQIEQARAICHRCPVSEACLDDALREEGARSDRYGIRGGLTDTERRQLRRRKDRGTGTTQRTLPPAATLAEALNRRATALFADDVYVCDFDHVTTDLETPIKDQGIVKSPVRFGDDVWVATKCVITRGTDIGSHSVVGAGAVVRGSFPPFVVVGGVPAKVLKRRQPVVVTEDELDLPAGW